MTPSRRTKLLIIAGAIAALAVIAYLAVPAILVKFLPLPPVPPPLEGEPLRVEQVMQPEPSRLAVQLRLPMSVLEEFANGELPREFPGRAKWKAIAFDYLLVRDEIDLASSAAGIEFTARIADGRIRPVLDSVKGRLSGKLLPSIAPNWQVDPGIKERHLDLFKADLHILLFGKVDIRKVLEPGFNWNSERIIRELVKQLQDELSARDELKRLWDEELTGLHAVDEERDAWVQVRPKKVLARPLDFSRPDEVTFHAAIDFAASAHVPKPTDPTPVPFPNLTIDPGLPTESEFRVPIAVSLDAANQLLAAETLRFDLNENTTFEATGISVKALEDGRMQVRVPFDVSRGLVSRKPIEDVLLLEGTPVIDLEGQRVGISGLSYSAEKGASWEQRGLWLVKPILLKQLETRLVWDLAPELKKLRQRANEELRKSLEESAELEGMAAAGEFEIEDVYLVRRGTGSAVFVVVLGARGDAQLRLRSWGP